MPNTIKTGSSNQIHTPFVDALFKKGEVKSNSGSKKNSSKKPSSY